MELRNINTFLHIAELHSFSRTARQLGYSQSAVSSQIAQLEAELGAPLFDRVGKTVRLTDAGQTFLGYARTLLATAQQAQAALQPARQISGSLRIALADSVCSTFLPGLLKRYHALCPASAASRRQWRCTAPAPPAGRGRGTAAAGRAGRCCIRNRPVPPAGCR